MSSNTSEGTLRLTVAQATVRYLSAQFSERDGVRRRLIPAMFGIFGHGNVAGMGQALHEWANHLPLYQPRNEQSMVHTAAGYAKEARRTATLACTASIGPGSTNMISGAAAATINRLPVLLLPSDYYVSRRQGPVLQQLEHPISQDVSVNDAFRPVSRFFDRVTRPEQLLVALPEAMRVLTDPVTTGAVTVSLPQDLQAEAYPYPVSFFAERTWRIDRPAPAPQSVVFAADSIADAKRPLIIAGGGVRYSDASEELQALSDEFGIPVTETSAGKGTLRIDNGWLLGGAGVNGTAAAAEVMRTADLVVCVGTRLTDFTTGSHSAFQNPDVRFVGVNIDPRDAFKLGALAVVGDAREAIRALIEELRDRRATTSGQYRDEIAKVRRDWEDRRIVAIASSADDGDRLSQGRLIELLHEASESGDTIVAAAGTPPGDLLKIWDATEGRDCHLEFGFSCMGYEIAAALGVKMAKSSGEVRVLIGDGTYLMNPTELVTAVQEGWDITVVVSRNDGFQSIRQLQLDRAAHSFATEFRRRTPTGILDGQYLDVDYAKNAESLGAWARHVTSEAELRECLIEAKSEPGPRVIVVDTLRHKYLPASGVWWDVAPAEVVDDPAIRERRDAYEKGRVKQRFHG